VNSNAARSDLKRPQSDADVRAPGLKKRKPLYSDEPATVAELYLQSAAKHPRADALNFKDGGAWRSISSAEMIERARNIALGLHSLGLTQGDRAALLAANSPLWTLADAGCQLAGIIDVPVYTTLADGSVEYILKDSSARVLFLENREVFERLGPLTVTCASLEKFIVFDAAGIDHEKVVSLSNLELLGKSLRAEKPELQTNLSAQIRPDDVATLIYTSGTTGEPKGVMLSHANILANVMDSGAEFSFSEKDIPLSVLPLSHIFERSGMYVYIYHGMAVHYAESIDKAPDNLKEVRPTIFVGVPRIFEKVYARARDKAAAAGRLSEMTFDWAISVGKSYSLLTEQGRDIPRLLAVKYDIADRLVFSKFREFFGGRLRHCISGGAALSTEINYIFNGAHVSIMQGYGLTETSPVISTNTPGAKKVGTVGRPLRNVEVRIASDGEIEVSGTNVMLGYYNKPDATNEAFTRDGWFKTGDIGEIDADGFLSITDRKKELFKTSGGKYIAPAPIEQMLKTSRFVNQVVLVGAERKFPAALIVPNFESLQNYAKLKRLEIKTQSEFCAHPRIIDLFERQVAEATKGISQFEKVKKIRLLENELTVEGGELTPTLKIKRRVINEKYAAVINAIYAD
jgi:long-chain acyl-CoA synthetase